MRKSKKIIPLSPVAQIVLASVLLIATILASRGNSLASWEKYVFLHVYNWPNIFHNLFWLITQAGSIYMLLILPLVFIVFKRLDIAIYLFAAGVSVYIIAGVFKDIFGRGRPHEFIVDAISRDVVHGPGYPSGHTALAVVLALTVGYYLRPKYYWIPAIWIILVGFSRVHLGAHLPLDIVGGFAIGWLIYAIFNFFYALPDKPKTKRAKPRVNKRVA